MGTLKLNNKSIDKYFGYLMNLDNDSKKRLIIKLTRSIDDKKSSKTEFEKLFGAWEDSRSAKEIIDDIRSARTQNREIEGFE